MNKWKVIISIISATALLAGCNLSVDNSPVEETVSENSGTLEANENLSSNTDFSFSTSKIVVDTEFTARDLDIGYEESTAVKITLNGSTADVSGKGVSVQDTKVIISAEGTYVLSGTLTNGQIIVDAGDSDKVQLVLNGIKVTSSEGAAIYVKNADKVFVTLAEGSENSLSDESTYVQTDDTNVDGVIFSKADLTLNGSGILNITGNYKHGIVSKDDLVITGGTLNITAVKDALNGKDCVKIKDGILNLSASEGNGIQSKNGDDETKGYVYICGGEINIPSCQEGIEGTVLIIDGGSIHIVASDDGLNSARGDSSTESVSTTAGFPGGGDMANDTNCYIAIRGGKISIDARGDGIDSNGSVYVTGGETYVSGPSNNGNAGLDYNGSAKITGGTIVVVGSTGMAQGFANTSTQYSLLYNLASISQANTKVKLTDADGNVLVSYTPVKAYQSVLISTPDMKQDATYVLTSGEQSAEVTLTEIATGSGEQGGFGGFGGRGGGDRTGGMMPPNGELPEGGEFPMNGEPLN